MTLIERLQQLAEIWCAAQGRSRARLATIVANDGKFFERLDGGSKISVATWEAFIRFFREPGNWPTDCIPADAAALLDEMKDIHVGLPSSPNNADEDISTGSDAAPAGADRAAA
jgi:hypothetical protein